MKMQFEKPPQSCLPALQIRFSTKSFGRDAAHIAAMAIKNCKATLVDADISDIIAGRPVRASSAQQTELDCWARSVVH